MILKDYKMPEINTGDLMVFENMGAYTTCLATTFNGIELPTYTYIVSKENALKFKEFGF